MSDPVTNVEIEDVLSSIRRLVSEDARPHSARDTGASAAMPVPNPSVVTETPPAAPAEPALILTPALRVAEDPAQDDGDAPALHNGQEDGTAEAQILDLEPVDDSAEVAEVAEPELLGEGIDLSEDIGTPELDRSEFDYSESDHGANDLNEAGTEETGADEAVHEAHDETAEDETNYDETAPEDTIQDNVSPEETGDAEHVDDAMAVASYFEQTVALGAQSEPEDNADLSHDADEQQDTSDLAFAPSALSSNESIEDKISALESLIARTGQEFEPDGAEVDATPSAPAMPWQQDTPPNIEDMQDPDEVSQHGEFVTDIHQFAEAHAAATAQVAEEIAQHSEEMLGDFEAAMPVLDEDALRDMVADIVRQELQGPLGERITRNVRKLVRREIYRALAANELD